MKIPAAASDDEQKTPATAESADVPGAPELTAKETKKRALPPDLVSEEPAEEKTVEPPDPDEQPSQPDQDATPFDDAKTDEAIDEIVAKEGDELLALQDEAAGKSRVKPTDKPRTSGSFWRHKWLRYLLAFVVLGGLTAALVMPESRYWILNTFGVRSSSSVIVVDSTTELPLKGVQVSLAGRQVDTDSQGKAKFSELKLGKTELVISQTGFQEIRRNMVIGWGSNPLGRYALKATGVRYVIEVRDYLSNQPVPGVEATDGQAVALSDKTGKISLTLASSLVAKDGVTLSKAGYRSDKIKLNEDPKKPTKATLVPARKAIFVAKQAGKYTVFKSDVDGQNRQVLLYGTGHENSNISLAVSPDGNRVAYVSTRDNKRDSSGSLKNTLVLIDTDNGSAITIAEASQIQLIDWVGPRIIFQLASPSGTSNRYSIVSYNYATSARLQLAAANQFNAVISAQGFVYYAVAADPGNPSLQLGLFKIRSDGNRKQRLFEQELTTVLRSTYDTLSLQGEDGTWYAYDLLSDAKTQIDSPDNLASRLYVDNSNRTYSLWILQGALKSYNLTSKQDKDVTTKSGLTYPVQWLSDTAAVFRVSSGSETADYAISLTGGQPRKVADVFPTYGFAQAQ